MKLATFVGGPALVTPRGIVPIGDLARWSAERGCRCECAGGRVKLVRYEQGQPGILTEGGVVAVGDLAS